MTAEDRIQYEKAAGGFVLSKTNKLRPLSTLTKDEDVLSNVHNLNGQIRSLEKHCIEHDIADVCTILVPMDVGRTSELAPISYNLWKDYPKLTVEMVANSNVFYNRWMDEPYVSENLTILSSLAKNNIQESLYQQISQEYDKFHPMQQGGTLMFIMALLEIYNSSEQCMEYLKAKVVALKLTSIEGENVKEAVGLLNSAYEAFTSASTEQVNRIPVDWSKDIIAVMQTSSVPEFNETFKDEEKTARRQADKNGGQPEWPEHKELMRLATTTYNRLKMSGVWDLHSRAKSKAYLFGDPTPTSSSSGNPDGYKCWNCGSTQHMADDCDRPRNEAVYSKNRDIFQSQRRGQRPRRKFNGRQQPPNGGRGGRQPFNNARRQPRQARDRATGRPLNNNRNGVYMLDQRELRNQRRLGAALQARVARPEVQPSAPPAPAPTALTTSNQPNRGRRRGPRAANTASTFNVQSILQDLL